MSHSRWARTRLVNMFARRLALREGETPRGVTRLLMGALLVLSIGLVGVLSGSTHTVFVALAGAGGMALLVALALRMFPTAMAVSVLGIALSCASLMTVFAVTTGFEQEIVRSVARLNGHVLLTKYGLDFREYDALSERWLQDARVTAALPFAYSMVALVKVVDEDEDDGNESRTPSVVVGKGIDPRRAALMDGFAESLAHGDVDALRPGGTLVTPGIVLGDGLAREVGVKIGDRVRIVVPAELDGSPTSVRKPPRHAEFEVLDTLHTGTSELDRNLALIHITAAQSLFFQEARVTGIEFQLTDPELAGEVAEAIETGLGYPYRTTTWESTNAPLLQSIYQVRIAVAVVIALMAVVAASSLIASLLLIVRRKRHDIGVLMAVGSTRGLVFGVFEAIGLVAGFSGAVLGTALGGLYCVVIGAYRYPLLGDVYPVDHLPVALTVWDALIPSAVAIGLCALASGPVAAMASRTRLLSALGR